RIEGDLIAKLNTAEGTIPAFTTTVAEQQLAAQRGSERPQQAWPRVEHPRSLFERSWSPASRIWPRSTARPSVSRSSRRIGTKGGTFSRRRLSPLRKRQSRRLTTARLPTRRLRERAPAWMP
ncbi:unnamed protein product, partial [Ectocarpus fasciculatus]